MKSSSIGEVLLWREQPTSAAESAPPVRRAIYAANVVYTRRKRNEDMATREAAGESLWTSDIDARARRRLSEIYNVVRANQGPKPGFEVASDAASVMRAQGGWPVGDFLESDHFLSDQRPTEFVLDALDSTYQSLVRGHAEFMAAVNMVFEEHRISFRMVEGEIVDFASDELMRAVVEPALRLLVGDRFKAAHDAYMAALLEDDPSDAITDAGSALQETLVALGCEGNNLGRLIVSAKKKGLFASHDQTLIDGITKFLDWASADRSESGDAHKAGDASRADAWLMIHVVGALIVRLADPALRSAP